MKLDTQEQLELINQQIKELAGLYRSAVSHSGISENEFWIWYTLIIMNKDYSQQDICNMWSLSKQTVNTIVTHMAQKGFIRLEVIPGTRNRKVIVLTDAGRQYGEAIVLPISSAEQRAFERLYIEERLACINALGNYIKLLKDEIYETNN